MANSLAALAWAGPANSPAEAINDPPGQFGVIVDGSGNLSGYAWGENVGWINFGSNYPPAVAAEDRPQVDVSTGDFSGFAWGENIGWINLDGSSTGGSQARVTVRAPTPQEIADGIIGATQVPLLSNRNDDGAVDAADVVTRVNAGP